MSKPIFIVGVPRSGTTLVRMILNAHSKIAIATETHFFRLFWASRDRHGDIKQDQNLLKLWDTFIKTKYFKDLKIDNAHEISKMIFSGERSYKAIYETILKEYARQNNKIRWGEKTPEHLEFVGTIFDFYPDAQVINVIRDPRDVALSFKKVPFGSNCVFSIARLWNRYIDVPKKQDIINRGSYLEVKYEDIVIKPKKMIGEMCAFINEEPDEKMFQFQKYSHSYIEKNEPWKNGCLQPLTTSNIGKWKNELSNWEIEQVILKCERRMIEKGYISPKMNIKFRSRILKVTKNIFFHFIWVLRGLLKKAKTK